MDAQQARKDAVALRRTQDAYKEFLSALAGSEAGQSFDSLMFAGESMLGLGMSQKAGEVFQQVLKKYQDDASFKKIPGADRGLLRARLGLAEALRRQRQFGESEKLIEGILKENPQLLEPVLEKGHLLQDWAEAESYEAKNALTEGKRKEAAERSKAHWL